MEQFFQQALQQSPDGILFTDVQGIIRFWNSGAERLFGYSAAEAVGQPLDLIIPENLRKRHGEGYIQAMVTGKSRYTIELLAVPGLRQDGSRISLEFSIVLLRGAENKVAGCAAIMRDVSQRRQKEKELKEALAACEGKSAANKQR